MPNKQHDHLNHLSEYIRPWKEELQTHALYSSIRTIYDVQRFMETHVYAVWDFMSLLKALQRGLTCVTVPWIPTEHPAARLINEIVRDEETDLTPDGLPSSHFSLYRRAMLECGADTSGINGLLKRLQAGVPLDLALEQAQAPAAAGRFVKTTFRIVEGGGLHKLAAAFAFGREDLVPEMFSVLVREMKRDFPGLNTFHYYLERHIEMDGEDHGPSSHRMVCELCGDDPVRWREAAQVAAEAMRARVQLWDSLVPSRTGALIQATS